MINPDPLGALTDQLTEALVTLLHTRDEAAAQRFSSVLTLWCAELIGRAAAQAASVSVPILRQVEDLEKRERRRSERVEELQRTVNGQLDAIWKHQLPDEQRNELIAALYKLAVLSETLEHRVETLEQRQVGGDAGDGG